MIKIPRHIIDAIILQAKNELPNEACGLLTGEAGEVRKQYPLTNMDHSPEHFSFDPKEQFAVLKDTRANGQQILANYHSHPSSPARPSEEDVRLAFDKKIIYVIVSLAEERPVVRAFFRSETTLEPCGIEIV
jgi:proteasome lid subunit RPN8/RPN11